MSVIEETTIDVPKKSQEKTTVWAAFIASKFIGIFIPLLAVWSKSTDTGFPANIWSQTFVHWDSQWYLQLAQSGYPSQPTFIDAFLPGFPLLIHIASIFTGEQVISGLFVNGVAEWIMLFLVYRLIVGDSGNEKAAQFVVWGLAVAPLAVYFTALYTESTFLALAVAALYFLRKQSTNSFLWACLCATGAVSVRITGMVLIPVLLYEYFRVHRLRIDWRLIAVVIVPLPFIGFMWYMRVHTGDMWAFFHAEASPSFGESLAWPWAGGMTVWKSVTGGLQAWVALAFLWEVVFGIAGLVACIWAWCSRRFPKYLAILMSLVWLSATSITFWRSVPRYELAMFPVLLLIYGALKRWPQVRMAFIVGSAGLMAYGAVLFGSGQWFN